MQYIACFQVSSGRMYSFSLFDIIGFTVQDITYGSENFLKAFFTTLGGFMDELLLKCRPHLGSIPLLYAGGSTVFIPLATLLKVSCVLSNLREIRIQLQSS